MALADIITKIDTDATATATAIAAAAEAEVATIMAAAKETVATIDAERESDVARTESKVKERAIAAAEHEAKFALQTVKVEAIERVFTIVANKLTSLNDAEYTAFVANRATAIAGQTGILTVDPKTEKATKEAVEKAGVTVQDVRTAAIGGGFILDTADAQFDHSFDTVLNRAREQFASDVAEALFNVK